MTKFIYSSDPPEELPPPEESPVSIELLEDELESSESLESISADE